MGSRFNCYNNVAVWVFFIFSAGSFCINVFYSLCLVFCYSLPLSFRNTQKLRAFFLIIVLVTKTTLKVFNM